MSVPTPTQSHQNAILPARAFQREWWICLLGLCAFAALLAAQGGLVGFDRAVYSQWMAWSAVSPRQDIVLIALDRSTATSRFDLAEPEPDVRAAAAALLERLKAVHPRAIGLALPWNDGPVSPLPVPNPREGSKEEQSRTNPLPVLADRALIQALEHVDHVVLAVPQSTEAGAASPRVPESLPGGAERLGFRDYRQEDDGLVRRAALGAEPVGPGSPDENWVAALAGAAGLRRNLPGADDKLVDARSGRTLDHIVGIPFSHSPLNNYPLIPYAAIFSGAVPLERFRGKFVLIGSAGARAEQAIALPGDGLFSAPSPLPALQVDAQLLAGLLDGRCIEAMSRSAIVLLSTLPAALALVALLLPVRGSLSSAVIVGLTLLVSYLLLRVGHHWFPPGAALAGAALGLPLWRWRELRATSLLLDRQFALLETQPGSFAESPFECIDARKPSGRWRFLAAARALGRVHELRRFLVRFIDDLSVPALVTNLDGHVVFANQAARHFFTALGNTQIDGAQLPYLLSTFQPDQVPANFSWWDIMDELPTHAGGRDPLGRDMLVWCTTWSAPGGELAGWVATLMETSAIRAAERTRDAALHFMTGELCAPVQGALALVRDAANSDTPSEMLPDIEIQARRTLELAEKFVQLAIASAHPYVFRQRPLHESIELAIDANEPFALGRGASIYFETGSEVPIADIDPDMFWRAVHTLVLNALRFNAPGKDIHVRLDIIHGGLEAAVRVRDYGMGIIPLDQARLVRMIQNIDLPGAQRGGGDLGLSFVKVVADRHRGRVEFTSNPGQGSEFAIILPCVRTSVAPREYASTSSAGAV